MLPNGTGHSSPEPDDICITGISGAYPNSVNVEDFLEKIMNKQDLLMVNAFQHPEIPPRSGKVRNLEKFDPGAFAVHGKLADCMDPVKRMALEKCAECILDAGYRPEELQGTKTGVYMGSSIAEAELSGMFKTMYDGEMQMVGCGRHFYSNVLSYYFQLEGPSCIIDTACSASLTALTAAYNDMKRGVSDTALVVGTNLCLHPYLTLQFARLGVLSPDGSCKCFDDTANGYARSDTICVLLLQKYKDARRLYSTVVHAKANCDGFKEEGISYPSGADQSALLEEFYQECNIDPSTVDFIEAHGTGTKVGDPEELKSIDQVFCKNRKGPLLIGSVKCNIGHPEPASGLCSITKAIGAMETGMIAPNINFSVPRKGIDALINGHLKVVTELTPLPKKDEILIGINSFGFGGSNAHTLLRWNTRKKVLKSCGIPRLVCCSSRSKDGVAALVDRVKASGVDEELIALIHKSFKGDVMRHIYRGYGILSKDGFERKSVQKYWIKKPLCIVFGDPLTGWTKYIEDLATIPLCRDTLKKANKLLTSKGLNLFDDKYRPTSCGIVTDLLANAVVQVMIVDVLKAIEVKPEFALSSLTGVFAQAYLEGCLDLEKTLLCVYYVAIVLNDTGKNCKSLDGGNKLEAVLNNCRFKILHRLNEIWSTQDNGEDKYDSIMERLFKPLHLNKISLPQTELAIFQIGSTIREVEPDSTLITVTPSTESKPVIAFLETIGRLYETGQDPNVSALYPKVVFPVSRGTPMIAPVIKWDHSKDYSVPVFTEASGAMTSNEERTIHIDTEAGSEFAFINGHVIDGRVLFPAMGYIDLVFDTVAKAHDLIQSDIAVVFEDVKFIRATTIGKDAKVELKVGLHRASGDFEVTESGTTVVKGNVRVVKDYSSEEINLPLPPDVCEPGLLPMKQKDIYKEMALRGYHYKDEFRALIECNSDASRAQIKWKGNFVTFMDNLLQMNILQVDSRSLYVPTGIKRLTIDAKKHLEYCESLGENPTVPAYSYKDCNVIKSGGIQVIQLECSPIQRRKTLRIPVLEKYVFVPNQTSLSLKDSLKVNVRIALDNTLESKAKVVEIHSDLEVVAPLMLEVLGDIPQVNAEVTLITKSSDFEQSDFEVKTDLSDESSAWIVILTRALSEDKRILTEATKILAPNGYLISREPKTFKPNHNEINILTTHTTQDETLVFFRPKPEGTENPIVIRVDNYSYHTWLQPLQTSLKTGKQVIVYSQGDETSGLLGLTNCVRREPECKNLRCVVIFDKEAPEFDVKLEFYKQQLDKGMCMNVLKGGVWGTYQHLWLPEDTSTECEHCYCNNTQRGDLSSLRWIEAPLTLNSELPTGSFIVSVYYSALNFRDVMTATGRVSSDTITMDRSEQECVQGVEFSGRDRRGVKVMGILGNKAMATLVAADDFLTWRVPENWTLEQAATVPVVYMTVIYALCMRAQIKKGDTILIHAGTGGVGQAAINICLHYGLTVFTTVGTKDKKEFIRTHFPRIKESHIGNSRDISFEQMVLKETQGRGVDFVLNSLAEEKLLASVRCLAPGGSFMEIGKFDLASDNPLYSGIFAKGCSFHGIHLDRLFKELPPVKCELGRRLTEGIRMGFIKPLPTHVFGDHEMETAFRFLANGKHMGKVLLRVREEEGTSLCVPERRLYKALPRFYCDSEGSYVLIGGLGGFGLELVDWMVLRGGRNFVLSTRSGVKNGYQSSRLKVWRSYGVEVRLSTADAGTLEGCKALLEEAGQLGPVKGIFNLALVLADNLLENQVPENFENCFKGKPLATQYMDELSRKMCPELSHFVVFSSVSCGRGNAGQSYYGMANSIMERICEKRSRDGFPATAIEWGAVGDVGVLADNQDDYAKEREVAGTLLQGISSCIQCLDIFLRSPDPVVSSMVVAEKRVGGGSADDIVSYVANIIGIRDLKTISIHSTLAELGMDSIMAVEIKGTLEREHEVVLTAQDVRNLTFARLLELKENAERDGEEKVKVEGVAFMQHVMGDEDVAMVPVMRLKSLVEENEEAPTVFVFPGLEGMARVVEPLAENLRAHCVCFQFIFEIPQPTPQELAERITRQIIDNASKVLPVTIIAYSYGTLVALEVIALLERSGRRVKTIFLDGAPKFVHDITFMHYPSTDEDKLQTEVLTDIFSLFVSSDIVDKYREEILKCKTWEERLDVFIANTPDRTYSEKHQRRIATSMYQRVKMIRAFKKSFEVLSTKIRLFRAEFAGIQDISEDYDLGKLVGQEIDVKFFGGNHLTILSNKEVHEEINKWLDDSQ